MWASLSTAYRSNVLAFIDGAWGITACRSSVLPVARKEGM